MSRVRRGGVAVHQVKVWGLRSIPLVLLVGGWLYLTDAGGVSPLILPRLSNVLSSFGDLVTSGDIWRATEITLEEMVAAFLISASAGLVTAFFLARRPLRAAVSEPLLAWGYMVPFVMLYPLFLLWVGIGTWSKIAYAAAAAFFPITYNSLRGLRSVDGRYTKVGVAFGASRTKMDIHVKAGAARPLILSGLRIGVSIVMISVVLAELLGSDRGLGYQLVTASSMLRQPQEYALILLLVIITALLQTILERLLRPRNV